MSPTSPARSRIAPSLVPAGSSVTAVGLRREVERARVDAVAHPGGPGPVVEDMTEVPAARRTDDLGADHAVARVGTRLHRLEVRRLDEAGPARPGVELRLRAEELGAASRAPVHAGLLGVGVGPRERPLCCLPAKDRVLLRRQTLAPFRVRQLDPPRHQITTSETATNWMAAATTTSRWKTSWKPKMRGNGSGHFVA